MMKLYYASGACSFAPHVMLNECGAPFELHKVNLMAGEQRTPEFLKINSRGQIPVLVDGEVTIREGAAILTYLAEKFDSPLLPKTGASRIAAIEAMMFCNATLHPAYGRVFFIGRQDIDAAVKAKLIDSCCASVQALWDDIEAQLSATRYFAGSSLTIADIMLAVMANWTIAKPVTFGPKTKALIAEISARPSYQKAIASEGVEYKAAA
jgi:glutathione S-transferase